MRTNASITSVIPSDGLELCRVADEQKPIPLKLTLQNLMDVCGISAILIAMVAVCRAKAAKVEEEGKDRQRWRRIASKLEQALKEV